MCKLTWKFLSTVFYCNEIQTLKRKRQGNLIKVVIQTAIQVQSLDSYNGMHVR